MAGRDEEHDAVDAAALCGMPRATDLYFLLDVAHGTAPAFRPPTRPAHEAIRIDPVICRNDAYRQSRPTKVAVFALAGLIVASAPFPQP
jgi:hypothetical protein